MCTTDQNFYNARRNTILRTQYILSLYIPGGKNEYVKYDLWPNHSSTCLSNVVLIMLPRVRSNVTSATTCDAIIYDENHRTNHRQNLCDRGEYNSGKIMMRDSDAHMTLQCAEMATAKLYVKPVPQNL